MTTSNLSRLSFGRLSGPPNLINIDAKGMPRAPPNHALGATALPRWGRLSLSGLGFGTIPIEATMSAAELIGMNLAGLTAAYASRALSPVEVLRTVLGHALEVNSAINALFCFRP